MVNWYTNFDTYALDHPEGEKYRNRLTNRKIGIPLSGPRQAGGDQPIGFEIRESPLRIVQGDGPHNGISGGFLWVSCSVRMLDTFRGYLGGWSYFVYVQDCDDGLISKSVNGWNNVLAEMDELCDLAPLDMWDLVEGFGYNWDM
jgi:hypothetical protein